jgi:hypothetical protein
LSDSSSTSGGTRRDGIASFDQLAHFGGLDWAQSEHQLVVVDPHGQIVLSLRFANDAQGWAVFRQKIAPFDGRLGIAIETSCGPAVERLLDAGLVVYPMNPKAATRYRDRKAPAGAKDDTLDAWSFADALRTDGHGWRALLSQDPLTVELRLLCRDEITLIEQRTALVNRLKAALCEYYPAALEAFDDWVCESSWRFVIAFPSPELLVKAGKRKWERFLHAHKLYRPETAQKRLECFAEAMNFASPNAAVTRAKTLLAVSVAKQLCLLQSQLNEYRQRIVTLFHDHPDHDCFRPRLLRFAARRRAEDRAAAAVGTGQQPSGLPDRPGFAELRRHVAGHQAVGPQPDRRRPPRLQQDVARHDPPVGQPVSQNLRLGRGLLPEETGRWHGPCRGHPLPGSSMDEDPLEDVADGNALRRSAASEKPDRARVMGHQTTAFTGRNQVTARNHQTRRE